MTPPAIVVVRPEPGNAETVARLRATGLDAVAAPLFTIEPVAWQAPDPADFDAVLLGSANAVRHGGPDIAELTALPAYAVGATTAEAARSAGFVVAGEGAGGLQELLPRAATDGRKAILRLAGEERVPLTVPAGVQVTTVVVYRAKPLELPSSILAVGGIVLLHSGAAARHFAAECSRLGLARDRIALACLGSRIAAAAGPGWRSVECAEAPRESALLALTREMCQTAADGVATQQNG